MQSLLFSARIGCLAAIVALSTHARDASLVSVLETGATLDGLDATAAFQRALDFAATNGSRVLVPPGRYFIKGSLRIPPGVTLEGVHDAPVWSSPLTGSIILATGGRDKEDGPALFEMGHSTLVKALTIYYPDQKPADIHPYPWTFHLQGFDNTVENVTLINSYNGLRVGPEPNVRHRIRSVYGCVLRRGILVDACSDIGRIENVQFHCHWWSAPEVGGQWDPVHQYMWKNCEAFVFGRTDWEYVNNTFVFPVNIGYRFIATKSGAANGQFSGIGADEAQICVKVDAIQRMGLLISNGQFVAFRGEHPKEIVIEKTCSGSVRLVDCAFWGPAEQNVVSHGTGFLSLSDCYFTGGDVKKNPELPLIEVDAGKLQLRGCSFDAASPALALREGLQHAIVSDNNGSKGVRIINEIGSKAILSNNEVVSGP